MKSKPRALNEVVDSYLQESQVDCVGLWEIAQSAREEMGAETPEEARNLSLMVVGRLYDAGLRPGDYFGRNVVFWPDAGRQAMLDRIEREWVNAGADPNPAEPICYFAPSPK